MSNLNSNDKIRTIFEELEIKALQLDNNSNNFDFSSLSEAQKTKVLDTLNEAEKNKFNYHTNLINANKEVELRRIEASIINQKTLRILLIGLGIIIFPLITLLILFFKEAFFIPWLTFITGIFGGFGLAKLASSNNSTQSKTNTIAEK